jgi:hypothetical protein
MMPIFSKVGITIQILPRKPYHIELYSGEKCTVSLFIVKMFSGIMSLNC